MAELERFKGLPVLAISVRQPWAWALFNGKHVENRSPASVKHMHAVAKPTPGRTAVPLMIHAAKGMSRSEYEHARQTIDRILGAGSCPRPDALVRSALIGHVSYVECITQSTSPWFFGPRGLVFENATLLDEPVPCIGALGFFKWRSSQNHRLASDPLYDFDRLRDAIEPPLPWMIKWRAAGDDAPVQAPSYIHGPAPAPLFDRED